MNIITGKYKKISEFFNIVSIELDDGTIKDIKVNRYIYERISLTIHKEQKISLALDKNRAFFMLTESDKFYINEDIEKSLVKEKRLELIFNIIPFSFIFLCGILLSSMCLLNLFIMKEQNFIILMKNIFLSILISLPAFYLSKHIMGRFLNLRKVLNNINIVHSMTRKLNSYKYKDIKNKETIEY